MSNVEIKHKQSIETYKQHIKYCEQQLEITKQLAEEEKLKLKRLEDAIDSM